MLHKKIENCFVREYSERSWIISEAVVQRSSVKKVFSEISQNSQENTCARVSFLRTPPVAASDNNLSIFVTIQLSRMLV